MRLVVPAFRILPTFRVAPRAAVLGMFGAVTLLTVGAGSVAAQRATQTVTFRVEAINQVSVSGSPELDITTAAAGHAPTTVTASGGTWNVTTNQTSAKISASLDAAMPDGLVLSLDLAPPPGATANGFVPLSATPVDLITNVSKVAASGLSVTYQLQATPAAGVVTAGSRSVVLTITGGM